MKIRYMSDLHLEFGDYLPPKHTEDSETTLVLAGDVGINISALPFLVLMCEQFKYVIYIFGNHEFYHHSIPGVRQNWKDVIEREHRLDNLYLLDDTGVTLDGVRFLGSTLWTDFQNDGLLMSLANRNINDFSIIFQGVDLKKLFTPMQSIQQHDMSIAFLERELKKGIPNTVVVTHHLPTYSSVSPRWRGSPLNASFATNLGWLMEKYKPEYWIHGHTHDSVHEVVDQTIVLCNPKGYGKENKSGFNPEASFEI